jgi:hypothetical protein
MRSLLKMSSLSFRLAKAAAAGRSLRWRPASREQVLARLLVKRAAAHQAGLCELESSLRQQIAWSLPIHRGENHASAAPANEAAFDHRL